MLIVRPGGDIGAAAYLALTTLVFTTTRDLTTRGLHRDVPSIFVAAASSAAIALAGFLVVPFDHTVASSPTTGAWVFMAASPRPACSSPTPTIIMALRTGEILRRRTLSLYVMVPMSIVLGYWLLG